MNDDDINLLCAVTLLAGDKDPVTILQDTLDRYSISIKYRTVKSAVQDIIDKYKCASEDHTDVVLKLFKAEGVSLPINEAENLALLVIGAFIRGEI